LTLFKAADNSQAVKNRRRPPGEQLERIIAEAIKKHVQKFSPGFSPPPERIGKYSTWMQNNS
jgi:hypothetical protein